VFQEMMLASERKPAIFQAIVVHSLSRFFRDLAQAVMYERKLLKLGIKLVSITQQTNDDPSGAMLRHMVMMFDEYQSKETAKHVLRGMQENARQGYFNGAIAPFGYRTVEAGKAGTRGRQKKKLVIEPSEASIVADIYGLYVHGQNGPRMGMKEIAKHLNTKGIFMRGKFWRLQKVHAILTSTTYCGWHVFNKRDSKTIQTKDQAEWIKVKVPAIIDQKLYDEASKLREANTPKNCRPTREHSPTLLTGLLKCDHCGAGMVIVTGKAGRYRYYKCTNRMSKGNTACPSINIPADKIDHRVLAAFQNKVYTPGHIRDIMYQLRDRLAKKDHADKPRLKKLENELKDVEQAQNRLLEAVEHGALHLDDVKPRAQQHKVRKDQLEAEIVAIKLQHRSPLIVITPQKIEAVARVLKSRLTEPTPYARAYLKATLSEIRVRDNTMKISGSHDAMATLIASNGIIQANSVPRSVPDWCTRRDSNSQPSDS
jgi:site-specific DNA recombinase